MKTKIKYKINKLPVNFLIIADELSGSPGKSLCISIVLSAEHVTTSSEDSCTAHQTADVCPLKFVSNTGWYVWSGSTVIFHSRAIESHEELINVSDDTPGLSLHTKI